jgi:hypothetical protein
MCLMALEKLLEIISYMRMILTTLTGTKDIEEITVLLVW